MAGKQRDLTQTQFDAKCKQYGFRRDVLGYHKLGDTPVHVYALNAGRRRRAQLAYLINEHAKALDRMEQ